MAYGGWEHSLAQDLAQMQRTPLADLHVARIRQIGTKRTCSAGQYIARSGDPLEEFIDVEDGAGPKVPVSEMSNCEKGFVKTGEAIVHPFETSAPVRLGQARRVLGRCGLRGDLQGMGVGGRSLASRCRVRRP